jgi:hypothetical protein
MFKKHREISASPTVRFADCSLLTVLTRRYTEGCSNASLPAPLTGPYNVSYIIWFN